VKIRMYIIYIYLYILKSMSSSAKPDWKQH